MDKQGVDVIGRRVRELRQEQELSQTELAHGVGISQAQVSKIETGDVTVTDLKLIQKFAAVLGVPTFALSGAAEPDPRDARMRAGLHVAVETAIAMDGGPTALVEQPRRVRALTQTCQRIDTLVQAGDYAGYAPLLPDLLAELSTIAATETGSDGEAAMQLLVRAWRDAWWVAISAMEDVAAWVLATRAVDIARLQPDPALLGLAQLLKADTLMWMGERTRQRGIDTAMAAVDGLVADGGLVGAGWSIAGELHQVAAYAHTAAGRYDDAAAHFTEMQALAEVTGEDDSFGGWFGPSLHLADQVWFAAERHLPSPLPLDDQLTLPPRRRCRLLTDQARCLVQDPDEIGQAPELLAEAKQLSPQTLVANRQVRGLVQDLRSRVGGPLIRDLATYLQVPA